LRIIGGKYKGLNIAVSNAFNSRPTTDYAREALFNIISCNFEFEEIKVLDLFTGTGIIGFEFVSRGCKEIDMVDINRKAVYFINNMAKNMNESAIRAISMESFKFVTICKTKYNIVFADPPYDMKSLVRLPDHILNSDIIFTDGWFILEHSAKHKFVEHPDFMDERKYGNVHFTFFKKNTNS